MAIVWCISYILVVFVVHSYFKGVYLKCQFANCVQTVCVKHHQIREKVALSLMYDCIVPMVVMATLSCYRFIMENKL